MRGERGATAWIPWLLLLACCRAVAYEPCPLSPEFVPSPEAFAVAARVLRARCGPLPIADPESFRLQSGWTESGTEAVRRRYTVLADRGGLAVVVERRLLVEPIVGLPYWSPVRADPLSERELADELERELAAVR